MPGLVEEYAKKLGWNVCPCNVIVEGTSDVELLTHAAKLYKQRHSISILQDQIAILHAGMGDEGGVEGLNLKLNVARQLALADPAADGSLRYRFIGLYDNDIAGRSAIKIARNLDRRLYLCRDLFLLQPVMPLSAGANHIALQQLFQTANEAYKDIDWEVEDLLSEPLLSSFEKRRPSAVRAVKESGDRKHREFTQEGKRELHRYAIANAGLEDMVEVVKLVRALRDYHRLQIDYIKC